MEELYKEECPHCYQQSIEAFLDSQYLNAVSVLNEVIAEFKAGHAEAVSEKLFNLYNNNLQKGIRVVFKPTDDSRTNLDYLYKFDANASKFAAYKANYVGNKLRELGAENFDAKAKAILKTYNRYQVTEYNSVVARCRTTKQFEEFNLTKDLFPNLEWIRSRSADPRELHLSFVGLVLPIDDSFWQTNYPGNLWGCKCDWRRTTKPASQKPNDVKPSTGLDINPHKDRELFSENHAYFKKATQKEYIDNFLSKNILKQFVKEKNYWVHPLQDRNASDIKDLVFIAREKAKAGKSVYICPTMDNQDNDLYRYLFFARKAYKRKCPDLMSNNIFYEYESFKKFTGNSVSNMISDGLSQSDKIIIDIRGTGINKRGVLNALHAYKSQKKSKYISELWILGDGVLEKVYP